MMPSGVVLILIGDTVFVLGVVGVVVVFILAIEAEVKFFAAADSDVDLRGL